MSFNYFFIFSLFLVLLVILNIYFVYILNSPSNENPPQNMPSRSGSPPSMFDEIFHHLNYLPPRYKAKNPKFNIVQKTLLSAFNCTEQDNYKEIWDLTKTWPQEHSLFPYENGAGGKLVKALINTPIALADNGVKGTQLKLQFLLENKQKLIFKPKRYNISHTVIGHIYAGFDRHNAEVLAPMLALLLGYLWVLPAAMRRVPQVQLMAVATEDLKRTTVKSGNSQCFYGKCYYCKINETVCADNNGDLEGAVILYLDKTFKIFKHPWRRSYSSKGKQMEWQTDNSYCKKVLPKIGMKRLLNLIEVAILDFLVQNGDRHQYETFKGRVVLLDNGKGLGNAAVDEMDILAPLYQCCVLPESTWQHLESASGGSVTDTLRLLSALRGEVLATEDHYRAIERRLLKVYATVQYCIGKHGSSKVFKYGY